MSNNRENILRLTWSLGLCSAAMVILAPALGAAAAFPADGLGALPANVIPPPLSYRTARYFERHPAAWADFVSHLPVSRPKRRRQGARTQDRARARGRW